MPLKLNPKQELFCIEYVKDFNAKQAAIRSGYSVKTARTIGSKLLTHVDVQSFLSQLMVKVFSERQQKQKRALLTVEELIELIQEIATADPIEAFDDTNTIKPLKDMPASLRRCISSIDVKEDYTEGVNVGNTTRIRFWDKSKNLEMLAKRLQLFVERKEIHNTHSLDYARVVAEKSTEDLLVLAQDKIKKLK